MQLSATFHGDRGICSSRPWQWLLSDPKPSVFFEMEKLELDIQSLKKERDAAISQKVALFHCLTSSLYFISQRCFWKCLEITQTETDLRLKAC